MSTNDCAPYATARTSILVHKGKGILVKRALTRDEAIKDAISEFDIHADAPQLYLTSFVGAQGQEVEISRSAFAFIRDTIPVHVHLREEDDSAERPRWPALPMAGLVQEVAKPDLPVQAAATSRFPYLFGRVGGEGSKTSESKIESKMESISDWQRHTSGTPDTSASVHRPRLETSQAPKPYATPVQSQEEMLSENAMNSLINKYEAHANSLPSSLSESQPGTSIPNHAGKAWNWFKKAGTLVKGSSAADAAADVSKGDTASFANVDPTSAKANTMQTSNALQLHDLPKRPSKDDMQFHRHTLSKYREIPKPQTAQITEEIETLLQSGHSPPAEQLEQTNHLPLKTNNATGAVRASENWGPGSLVLDDGISESSTTLNDPQDSKRPPWWAKPVDAFDEKNRRKLGLKPLHLKRNETGNIEDFAPEGRELPNERNRSTSRTNRPPSIATAASRDRQIQTGKVSPGVPLAGQRRTRMSRIAPINKDDNNARPLPADIPESPFSSRRFTRLDSMQIGHRAAQSRGMIPHDAVPDEQPSRGLEGHLSEPTKSNPPRTRVEAEDALPTKSSKEARARVQRASSDKSEETASNPTRSAAVPPKEAITNLRGAGTDPKPTVPVAFRPHVRPVPVSRSSSQQSGTFAAAAMAARRQITRDGSTYGEQHAAHQDRHGATNDRRTVKQRTSLSSLKDFVAANLPDEEGSQAEKNDDETAIVNVQRLVLGPMDLSSPNRKGSTLVLKAKLGLSQLSLEWQPESKVVLNLPFDAIAGLRLPDPDCSESFIIIKPTTGDVRSILIEVDAENLLVFQRFVLVFIMGLGADLDHVSPGDFCKISEANGW